MHKQFAEWYRVANIPLNGEDLQKRWQTIESFGKQAKMDDVLQLVRLYFGLPASEEFVSKYTEAFQHDDPAFPMRKNDLELTVLSGATVVNLFSIKKKTPISYAGALALIAGETQGNRKRILNRDIIDLAKNFLNSKSAEIRKSDNEFRIPAISLDLEQNLVALDEAGAGNNLTVFRQKIRAPFESLFSGIESIPDSVNKTLEKIGKQFDIYREESNILWWIIGEYSRDFEKPLSNFPLSFAAILSGKELSDMINRVPGPLAAVAFLDKALGSAPGASSRGVDVVEGVNAAPIDWKKSVLDRFPGELLGDFCVLHYGISKSLELDETTWPGAVKKRVAIENDLQFSARTAAFQMYTERMLHKAIVDASK